MKYRSVKTTSIFLLVLLLTCLVILDKQKALKKGLMSNPDWDAKEKNVKTSQKLLSERKKRMKALSKPEHPDYFADYHKGIRTRAGEQGPTYPVNHRIKELLKARGLNDTKALSKQSAGRQLNWVERGPGNVSGRTRALVIDPTDSGSNSWYAGSTGGGVWKTEDAGQNWRDLTRHLPNLATSSLAISPANPNVIYAGTGEGFGFFAFIYGSGIWKSENGGEFWGQLPATANNPEFRNVMRLIVDPDDENIVLAVTAPGFRSLSGIKNSAIFRSEDGGLDWTKVYESEQNDIQQIIANPLNFQTQYATINSSGVIKSTDGGQTWVNISNGIDNTGGSQSVRRLELAIAPTDTSVLYLSAETDSPGSILYRSQNGGATWSMARESQGSDVNWLGTQGWYDNAIAVSPYDANEIYVGGINLWKINVETPPDTIGPKVTGVEFDNTESFLAFHNFDQQNVTSGISTGSADLSDFSSIEIRFGLGRSQKGHRFVVPAGATSGVPDQDYTYRDYVDVPFEVWDIDNNRQLMVSFRDQTGNGEWELTSFSSETTREYLFIHAVPYSEIPSASIALPAGHTFKQLYFIWPELANSGTWNPDNLPSAILRIKWGFSLEYRINTEQISNWFPGLPKPGGGTFPFVHADHHNLTLIPTDPVNGIFKILNANDGGVEFSYNNGIAWNKTLNGYNTTQFYGVDKMNGGDRYVGGTQDNGTWVSPENPDSSSFWAAAPSGDGFQAVWNYDDSNKLLESSQFNNIFRSLDGGNSWLAAAPGDVGSNTSPFFTKLAKSKQDADLVFAVGISGVWRTDNFGSQWTRTRMPQNFNGRSSFTDIEMSLCNPQIVWTGSEMRSGRAPFVSMDGGFSFAKTGEYSEVELGVISGLETHPSEDSTAYALFSFANAPKILRTTDLGENWQDISGFGTGATSSNGFPDVAVYSLLVMPFDTNMLWVGTEIGLFESFDNGQTWHYADNGLPAASVFDMLIVNNEIVVATHGRGIWSVELPELQGYEPPEAILAPRFNKIVGGTIISADIALKSPYDSTHVLVNGEKRASVGRNEVAKDTVIAVPVDVEIVQAVDLSLISFKDGQTYQNAATSVVVFPLNAVQTSYTSDFNSGVSNFILRGLFLGTPSGFVDGALQSPHNYQNNASLTAIIPVPIRVADNNAMLSYDDVAIVEPGREGSAFGDHNFFDYVIVEGSNDLGFSWRPLLDGYDARANTKWLNAFENGQPGAPDMYVNHEVNLLDTFSPGEEILVRFRLFADAGVNAWGWAVDNLRIQESVVSVEPLQTLPKVFSLSQNYPNPFNPSTQITYSLPQPAQVSLKIYNVLGRQVQSLLNQERKPPGVHTVSWDGKNESGHPVSSGVYFYQIIAEISNNSKSVFSEIRKMLLVK